MTDNGKLTIDPDFRNLLSPLTATEKADLLANLKEADICRENIAVWPNDGKRSILDGHHRYELCEKHGIAYGIDEVDLPSKDAAIEWIFRNQAGRRNLTPQALKLLRGRWYNHAKKVATDNLKRGEDSPKGQNGPSGNTAENIAKQTDSSERTVKRNAAYAENLDKLSEPIRKGIESGATKATDSDVAKLAEMPAAAQAAAVKAVAKGEAKTLGAAIKAQQPNAAPKKPPRQLDRPAYYKQWDQAIGPIVRLVVKIGHGVGEHNGPKQKRVEKALHEATAAMAAWMGVE